MHEYHPMATVFFLFVAIFYFFIFLYTISILIHTGYTDVITCIKLFAVGKLKHVTIFERCVLRCAPVTYILCCGCRDSI